MYETCIGQPFILVGTSEDVWITVETQIFFMLIVQGKAVIHNFIVHEPFFSLSYLHLIETDFSGV